MTPSTIAASLLQFRTEFERTAPNLIRPPGDLEQLREQAERIVDGGIPFNGVEYIQVGIRDIDWLGKHRQHQEWPAQLNRFFVLDTLIMAWRTTRDLRYPERARVLIEDWLEFQARQDPDAPWHPGDNHLNLVIRIGNSCFNGWTAALFEWGNEAPFDDDFVARMINSIARQLDGLIAHGFLPCGNQRLAELDTVLLTGLRMPFLQRAAEYVQSALPLLRNDLRSQFLADGTHVELTPNYHFWMARLLRFYYALSREQPELELGIDRDLVIRATRLEAYFERFPVNDSHLHDPSKRCTDQHFRAANTALTTLGESELQLPLPDLCCEAAGFFFAADDQSEVFFDASSYGGSHTHCSRLQVALNYRGWPMVIDPGAISYEMSDPMAGYGKSTPAHSTVNLDNLNQGPAAARMLEHRITDTFAFAEACFEGGYWTGRNLWGFQEGVGEGRWARHTRAILMVKNDYVLILDAVPAELGRMIYNNWQLAPYESHEVDPEAGRLIASRRNGPSLLLQLVHRPMGEMTMTCCEGQRAPIIRGWAGAVAAPHLSFMYPGGVPAGGLSAILLKPFGSDLPQVSVLRSQTLYSGIGIYVDFQFSDGTRDTVAWAPGCTTGLGDVQDLSTDATIAFVRRRVDAKPVERVFHNGVELTVK